MFKGYLIVFRTWSITDVYGLDDELLAMVPTPVTSLLLLFPLTNKVVDLLKEKDKSIEQPQEVKKLVILVVRYFYLLIGFHSIFRQA
jgi:hypothetical protein